MFAKEFDDELQYLSKIVRVKWAHLSNKLLETDLQEKNHKALTFQQNDKMLRTLYKALNPLLHISETHKWNTLFVLLIYS